jgi:hypothetical protein
MDEGARRQDRRSRDPGRTRCAPSFSKTWSVGRSSAPTIDELWFTGPGDGFIPARSSTARRNGATSIIGRARRNSTNSIESFSHLFITASTRRTFTAARSCRSTSPSFATRAGDYEDGAADRLDCVIRAAIKRDASSAPKWRAKQLAAQKGGSAARRMRDIELPFFDFSLWHNMHLSGPVRGRFAETGRPLRLWSLLPAVITDRECPIACRQVRTAPLASIVLPVTSP